jgi:hypothetical protein
MTEPKNKKVLLHICCGVCAGRAVEQLREEGFEVTGFFYNPNIYPEDEYARRLEAAKSVAAALNFELLEGKYEPGRWNELVKGLENEPEGGSRCTACFGLRLAVTKETADKLGMEYFTATLTISPHKNAELINRLGAETGEGKFLARDFKKKDGFKKAMALAKSQNIYRQNYCGCESSLRIRASNTNKGKGAK